MWGCWRRALTVLNPAEPRHLKTHLLLPSPWNECSAQCSFPFLYLELVQGCSLESNVLWNPSRLNTWLNPIKDSIKTQNSDRLVLRSTHLAAAKWSLVCKSSCYYLVIFVITEILIRLLSTNLDWSASFFGFSLPFVYQFQTLSREPLKFWGYLEHFPTGKFPKYTAAWVLFFI